MKKPRNSLPRPGAGGASPALQYGALLAVCLFAFAIAIVYLYHFGLYNTDYWPDEGRYIAMSRRILTEHVYSYWGEGSDAYVSFGFPLFLTAGMALFGADVKGLLCIKILQCLLAAVTVFLTYLLGWMLTKKYSVGLIAAVMIALNPVYYLYTSRLLTETFYFFTMMLFFVVFLWARRGEKLWRYALAGALFALTVMVRPLIVVTLPFLFLPSLVERWKQWKVFFTPVLLFSAGFIVVCLPWWIRNLVTLGQFIPLATQTNPIYAGLAPNPDAMGLTDPGSFVGNLKLLFQLIAEDPVGTLHWMTFGKFDIFFMQPVAMTPETISTFMQGVTVWLGLFGALRTLFTRRYWGPTLVFWAYLAASFLFIPVSRYALQYFPFMAICAGYLLVTSFSNREDP